MTERSLVARTNKIALWMMIFVVVLPAYVFPRADARTLCPVSQLAAIIYRLPSMGTRDLVQPQIPSSLANNAVLLVHLSGSCIDLREPLVPGLGSRDSLDGTETA